MNTQPEDYEETDHVWLSTADDGLVEDLDWSGSARSRPDSAVALGAGGDLDEDADARFSDHSDGLLFMDLVGGEEDMGIAPCSADQLAAAAERHFSNSRKGPRKKEALSFDVDDFEAGAQQHAFIIIKSFKNDLFGSLTTGTRRWAAIEWFFTRSHDTSDVTFPLCCEALGARIDVIRLRIQYEFYLRWWLMPREFPFHSVSVPSIIDGEIAYVAGEVGRDLATIAWNKPGINTTDLLDAVGYPAISQQALDRLSEKMILSEQTGGNWYLTGRNPHIFRQRLLESRGHAGSSGGSVHWSKLL